MKKLYYFILVSLAIVVACVSCEKDDEAMLITLNVANENYVISYTSAEVVCNISSEATIKHVYLQYSTVQDFDEYKEIEMQGEKGIYQVQLTDLQDNTTYYIRYAASNRFSSIIGDVVEQFQTLAPSVPSVVFDTITTVWDTYANIQLHLEFDGGAPISEMGVCWNTQTAPVVENYKLTTKDTTAALEIKDLQPNTQYFVRAYAINKVGVAYSEEYEFTTFSLPEIKTEDITDMQLTTALLNGILVFNGNDTATIKGFCWSTNDEPTLDNDHIELDTTSATYTYRLSNLIDETQYYVRAYARNKIGIVYGENKSFTTKSALPPTVSTKEVMNVEYHTATITAEVASDGGASVTERGICYSTTENPTTESTKIVSGKGTGNYTVNLTELQDSTTYYVRAYAINKKGIAYGEQMSFMTKGYKLPIITTATPSNVEYHSATIGGNISSDGGAEVTERGICYSTTANPTIENSKIVSGKGTGSYTSNLTDLQDSTTYYVRAYAINKKGIAYGEQVSFMTKGYKLPTITTTNPTNVEYTSATIGGNVSSDGGAEVTERGICYSTTENPTTESTKIVSGNGIGSYTVNLTDLQDSTTYYVRAYAINKKGIAYGEQMSFMTKGYMLPTITTANPTNVEYTSATIGGNISSDGGAEVTERGICYYTTENPTIESTKILSGKGTGSYTINLTDLKDSTIYYIRAYAINKKGIAYGEQVSFMTKGYILPVVTTTEPSYISYTFAVIAGSIVATGEPIYTESGIVYGTNPNPTILDNKKLNTNITDQFTCKIENLQPGSLIYARAYALNKKGVAYGEDVKFTTKVSVVPEYVDLGLSVKWATFNIGASSPEEAGDYFAWGEIEPKEIYNGDTYKYSNGTAYTKYTLSDKKIVLDPSDDAAKYRFGGDWRMPTKTEIDELEKLCIWVRTTQNNVNGCKITGPNGNSIFLLTAGYRVNEELKEFGFNGQYCSSSIYFVNTGMSEDLSFCMNTGYYIGIGREAGKTIRPVYGRANIGLPIVKTLSTVDDIKVTASYVNKIEGQLQYGGGDNVTEWGIVYSKFPNPTISDTKVISSTFYHTYRFACDLNHLAEGTKYYVRTYAVNSKGVAYGEEINFETKKYSDLGIGCFSVSDGKQVTFSKGNLQYNAYADKWRFAGNQWDYIGVANSNISSTYNGWIDLFGWSGSAGTAKFGVSSSINDNDYEGDFYDWSSEYWKTEITDFWKWSTLGDYEWEYLIERRPNASNLIGVAQVNGVNGLVLLPDNWICPDGITFKAGFHDKYGANCYADWQNITIEQWSKLEAAGAVFLPAAGERKGTSLNVVQEEGLYWSSTHFDTTAFLFHFYSNRIEMYGSNRYRGQSVRLVRYL